LVFFLGEKPQPYHKNYIFIPEKDETKLPSSLRDNVALRKKEKRPANF
jgi:hypothetical protein